MEELITCERCGGNACLKNEEEAGTNALFCFGCGFTTSTVFTNGNESFDNMIQSLPDLHKDLFFQGEQTIWIPSVVTLPEKGMVFADGTSKDDWLWAGVLTTAITEEESNKFPEHQKNKIDHTTMKYFDRKDFMDALEYIGFFDIED